jgi:hypothetical protein
MRLIGKSLLLFAALLAAPAALAAAGTLGGTWAKLPSAPAGVLPSASVWTGKQLIVIGRGSSPSAVVAESYDGARRTWKLLAPPANLRTDPSCCTAVWSGREALVYGAFSAAAYDPAANAWHALRRSIQGGILVWTGREAIAWGGGCCGDARANGHAYNPTMRRYRTLARSPLAPSQGPVGAWTGHELLLFVSGFDPDGKPYPASLARGAAYNPATNRWRRLSAMPVRPGNAVWDGRELLVAGGGSNARALYSFDPAANRWRPLASLPFPAPRGLSVWTGKLLFVWSGTRGASYDPSTNRWSVLPHWPLEERSGSAVAWTSGSLIVWGGEIGTPLGTSTPPKFPLDGAAFTPEVK